MNTKKLYTTFMLSIILGLILSACGTAEPAEQAGELAAIDFAEIEVGQGSPTPVTVTIDVSYPSTCAQISQISQEFVKEGENTRILIEVRTMNMGEVCAQEALSFRMVLPLNAVAMPKGTYTVEVNGVNAGSFEFQN